MFSLFKKKTIVQYYSEIPFNERIDKIFEELVFPKIEGFGFSFSNKATAFIRKDENFKQSIIIQKSRKNTKDVSLQFNLIFTIECTSYSEWYKKKYNEKLPNDFKNNNVIFWGTHNDIPNWSEHFNAVGWYDLLEKDNKLIVDEITNKLKEVAIPFFNQFSSIEKAIDFNIANNDYTKIPMLLDFCEMTDNVSQRDKVKSFYFQQVKDKNLKLDDEIIAQIEKRV